MVKLSEQSEKSCNMDLTSYNSSEFIFFFNLEYLFKKTLLLDNFQCDFKSQIPSKIIQISLCSNLPSSILPLITPLSPVPAK